MFTYQGKTALITGASSGIGTAFAYALAARGMNVVLVARSEERLRTLAAEIAQQHTVYAEVIVADLSQEQGIELVSQQVEQRGLTIDLLINNAGFGTHGYFESIEPARDRQEVLLNVAAVVGLAHAFIPAMVARGAGAIINVASVAAFQPVPYMSVYGASKAFVLSFSEALAAEYRHTGIHILALCPGATETPFFQIAGEDVAFGNKHTTDQVVTTGLRALEQEKSVAIDGFSNAAMARLARILPGSITELIAEPIFRPKHARVKNVNTSTVAP